MSIFLNYCRVCFNTVFVSLIKWKHANYTGWFMKEFMTFEVFRSLPSQESVEVAYLLKQNSESVDLNSLMVYSFLLLKWILPCCCGTCSVRSDFLIHNQQPWFISCTKIVGILISNISVVIRTKEMSIYHVTFLESSGGCVKISHSPVIGGDQFEISHEHKSHPNSQGFKKVKNSSILFWGLVYSPGNNSSDKQNKCWTNIL